jgi:hypothetical protein
VSGYDSSDRGWRRGVLMSSLSSQVWDTKVNSGAWADLWCLQERSTPDKEFFKFPAAAKNVFLLVKVRSCKVLGSNEQRRRWRLSSSDRSTSRRSEAVKIYRQSDDRLVKRCQNVLWCDAARSGSGSCMRMVMIRGHEYWRSLRRGQWWYFLAGGTWGCSLGRNNGDGETR